MSLRFWPKVKIGDPNECWEWQACRVQRGYGRIGLPGYGGTKIAYAHRVAYALANNLNELPDGEVLHSCDNPPCCNPSHLSVGTHAENLRQSVVRGRSTKGEKNHQAKLNWDKVREIRRLNSEGIPQSELAERYGVSRATICNIMNGKTWRKS